MHTKMFRLTRKNTEKRKKGSVQLANDKGYMFSATEHKEEKKME